MKDLTASGYVHPSTKQCNYSYSHPSTPQCNVSSRLDSIENKVNTTSGVPRWYFDKNGTWKCPETALYTIILVGGGGGGCYKDDYFSGHYGGPGEYVLETLSVSKGNYSITIGEGGIGGSYSNSGPGSPTRISGLGLSAAGGSYRGHEANNSLGYMAGTLIGSGSVGAGGIGMYNRSTDGESGGVAIY